MLLEILDFVGQKRNVAEVAARFGFSKAACGGLVQRLLRTGLIEHDQKRNALWDPWDPHAGLLHFATRDTEFPTDISAAEHAFQQKEKGRRPPRPVTNRAGRKVALVLPAVTAVGAQLARRRTWRSFGSRKITLTELSTLLNSTFAVQHWARSTGGARVPLKTAPSGGACHPIEAYVVALGVKDLEPGLYHFNAARRNLTLVRAGANRSTLREYLPSQPWFWSAPAVVLMVSVFERTIWRYPSPRSYRNVFLEAGHLAQSFCLVATELGLAPFCTHALIDSAVDRDLQLDGIREGVVYAVGCGARPRGGWRPGIPDLKEHR